MFTTELDKLNRFSAFGIHLGISLVIFAVLAYLLVFVWYPAFFFDTDGGWRGMRIIIAVDLILGPTLTLVVFKAGKPGLKTDLTLIGMFQLACLAAGTYVVYSERPIAVVYVGGEFFATSDGDYRAQGKDVPDLGHIPGNPKWVSVELPDGLEESTDIKKSYIRKGHTLDTAVEYYRPFDATDPEFVEAAEALDTIKKKDERLNFVAPFLAEHGGTLEDYRFYPYSTRYQYTYLAFSLGNEFVGLLDTPAY